MSCDFLFFIGGISMGFIKCLFGHHDKHIVAVLDGGNKVVQQCKNCNKVQIYDLEKRTCTKWIHYNSNISQNTSNLLR